MLIGKINNKKKKPAMQRVPGWLFYRVCPTPTLPQAASANTSSLAFIDFAWITSIAYRVVHLSTHPSIDTMAGPL